MNTKDKVLEILKNQTANKSFISGEKLAETCGVTRAAIWKAVKSLRELGYPIEGTTNGGYVLLPNDDVFTPENFKDIFFTYFPDFHNSHIEYYKEIDSTNSHAKRLLAECGNLRDENEELTQDGLKFHNSIIVAESQTAGRGRLGRTFYSPSKTGIYISVIYAPKGGIVNPAQITACSAVAICRVLKRLYNLDSSIKWINDIFINGKKIAGILTEGSTNFETGRIESAIIGIGINISKNTDFFPPEVQKVAGCIEENSDCSKNISRCLLAANIAGETLSIFKEDNQKVIEEYKNLSCIIGQTVQVHSIIGDDKSVYNAKAIDIDNNAGLIVELEDGTKKTLSSSEVTLHKEN